MAICSGRPKYLHTPRDTRMSTRVYANWSFCLCATSQQEQRKEVRVEDVQKIDRESSTPTWRQKDEPMASGAALPKIVRPHAL